MFLPNLVLWLMFNNSKYTILHIYFYKSNLYNFVFIFWQVGATDTTSCDEFFKSLPDPTSHWELLDPVGEGTYGGVFRVRNLKTGAYAAAKSEFICRVIDFCLKVVGLISHLKVLVSCQRSLSQRPVVTYYWASQEKYT